MSGLRPRKAWLAAIASFLLPPAGLAYLWWPYLFGWVLVEIVWIIAAMWIRPPMTGLALVFQNGTYAFWAFQLTSDVNARRMSGHQGEWRIAMAEMLPLAPLLVSISFATKACYAAFSDIQQGALWRGTLTLAAGVVGAGMAFFLAMSACTIILAFIARGTDK